MRRMRGSGGAVRLRTAVRRALWGIILVSYLPLFRPFLRTLWASEQYRFFPLIAVGFTALVWLRLREEPGDPPSRGGSAFEQTLWLFAAWLLLAAAVLLWSSWLAAFSAVIAARAVLLQVGARRGQRLTGEWLLLWLVLPLPFRWDTRLSLWIEGMAARWGSDVLDFFRVPNLVAGTSIHLPGHALPVDDACGGIAASVFLVALAAMFVLWMRRPGFIPCCCSPAPCTGR